MSPLSCCSAVHCANEFEVKLPSGRETSRKATGRLLAPNAAGQRGSCSRLCKNDDIEEAAKEEDATVPSPALDSSAEQIANGVFFFVTPFLVGSLKQLCRRPP